MNWELLEIEGEIEDMMTNPSIDFSCPFDRQELQMIWQDKKNIENKEMQIRPLWFQIISNHLEPKSRQHEDKAWEIFNDFKFFAWALGDQAYNPQIETINKYTAIKAG